MIIMNDVHKTYPSGNTALNGINISIDSGEFVYVVGPSGAGKSTFVKLMYRETNPSQGEIIIRGTKISEIKKKEVPMLRRSVGVVFQDFKLLPKLTVYENVAFALEVIEAYPSRIRDRTMEVLELVGLKNKVRSFPNELSGGEQQRVSIARAISNEPNILIADEPTGNLDPDTSWAIMRILEEINATGTTVLMATHNKEIVNTIKKRVIAIENGIIVRDEDQGAYGYEI
ncbi:MAG TPA: cell division ATP-binding protein FtsE [Pseudogracilibacillus sp.]|nr:cell division ATP-binding protein FtsE [Pseudogracilibacillus sp.]